MWWRIRTDLRRTETLHQIRGEQSRRGKSYSQVDKQRQWTRTDECVVLRFVQRLFFSSCKLPSLFSDLDSIVAAVPTIYGPRELSNTTSPFISAPNSTNITGGTTGSQGSNSIHSAAPSSLLLLVFTVILLLRPLAGKRIPKFC